MNVIELLRAISIAFCMTESIWNYIYVIVCIVHFKYTIKHSELVESSEIRYKILQSIILQCDQFGYSANHFKNNFRFKLLVWNIKL